jgi:hypothetical protein
VHRFDVSDAAAVRALIAGAAEAAGLSFEALAAPLPAGRLSAENRARRDVLAVAVADARAHGATLHVLAAVLRRPLSTVHLLAERGSALRG